MLLAQQDSGILNWMGIHCLDYLIARWPVQPHDVGEKLSFLSRLMVAVYIRTGPTLQGLPVRIHLVNLIIAEIDIVQVEHPVFSDNRAQFVAMRDTMKEHMESFALLTAIFNAIV
jgi:hypothetical protein